MTNEDIDRAILRYTLVSRDYRGCLKRGTARCKPNPTPTGVYQYEPIEKHVNVCTSDEV